MNHISIREARKRLSDIVDAAERGEKTVITRRGRQVAVVEPIRPAKGRPLPNLSEFRSSIAVKGKSLSRLIAQARKETRY
jgi:prevent-host-death family protein